MEIVFYLARADNGVIGDGGTIPWHIPGEQRRFKAMTMGKPMIMGRKTFESFPAPLPGRRHIVLTRARSWSAAGAEVAHSPAEALARAGDVPEIAVIGGAEVFALFDADRVELTEVHAAPPGDARVSSYAPDAWAETMREERPAGESHPAYSYVTLERRR